MANQDTEVTIYLLHFDRPYKGKMRHYLGFTSDLDNRLMNHRCGTACVTTKRAFDRGIGFVLARTWLAPVRMERAIKSHGVVRSCPICTPDEAATLARPT
jgi:predicted GIY-YIG superfamily endonuclease